MTLALVVASATVGNDDEQMSVAALPLRESVSAGPAAGARSDQEAGQGHSVLGRLCDQLGSFDIRDTYVIARPGHGAELRAFCHELVESPGPADDLRRLARMARTAGEPVVVLGGDVVA
ncbi:MAG: hypothetical protein GEV11_28505, partial [Streptosporangiales bacterium]|nr:hypothetical protein [Streptosporangiales bacterium]